MVWLWIVIVGTFSVRADLVREGVEKVDRKQALFAGGCFWCMQPIFDHQEGVSEVYVGYSGGEPQEAKYREVCTGATKHREVIHMWYNPKQVTFKQLMTLFISQIDPTDQGGQFADRGEQYRTAIYHYDEEQKNQAEEFLKKLGQANLYQSALKVEVLPAGDFFRAEAEHQKYYQKQPIHYEYYKKGSGRARFIDKMAIKLRVDHKSADN